MTQLPSQPSAKTSTDQKSSSLSDSFFSEDVLLAATELFVSRECHDEAELIVFTELFSNLLPVTSEKDRRRISCLLIRYGDVPPSCLIQLGADEDPLTAYPVLRHGIALPSDILLLQTRRGPDSLRKAIAGRKMLSEPLMFALAETGGVEVVRALFERSGVALHGRLIDTLMGRPEIMIELGAILADRGVFSSDQLMDQFLDFPATLRAEAIASAELEGLVALTRSGAHQIPQPVFKSSLLDSLKASALSGTQLQFTTDLAYALGLPETLAHRIVFNDSGEAFAIALKVLGFDQSSRTSLLVSQLGRRLDLHQIGALVDLSSNISHGAARLLVGRWIGSKAGRTGHNGPVHTPQFQESSAATSKESQSRKSRIEDLLKVSAPMRAS